MVHNYRGRTSWKAVSALVGSCVGAIYFGDRDGESQSKELPFFLFKIYGAVIVLLQ